MLLLTASKLFAQIDMAKDTTASQSKSNEIHVSTLSYQYPNYQYQNTVRYYSNKKLTQPLNAKVPFIYPTLNNYNKFPMATFFTSKVFALTKKQKEEAMKTYKPILDSIFNQASNDNFLHAEVLIAGYTDDENEEIEVEEYYAISKQLNRNIRTKNVYKNAISYLRALAIQEVICDLLTKYKFELNNYNDFMLEIKAIGRGALKPENNRNYESTDSKRRLVKVYWQVF